MWICNNRSRGLNDYDILNNILRVTIIIRSEDNRLNILVMASE